MNHLSNTTLLTSAGLGLSPYNTNCPAPSRPSSSCPSRWKPTRRPGLNSPKCATTRCRGPFTVRTLSTSAQYVCTFPSLRRRIFRKNIRSGSPGPLALQTHSQLARPRKKEGRFPLHALLANQSLKTQRFRSAFPAVLLKIAFFWGTWVSALIHKHGYDRKAH